MAESFTFVSPDGQHERVYKHPADIVRMKFNGWREKSAAETEPLPSPTARKDEWAERAEALGLDTDGKTKAELQEAVEAKVGSQGDGGAVESGAPGIGGQTGSATAPTASEVTASTASKPARR